MCFHKYALSLFLAIDRAKNSFFFLQNVSNFRFVSPVCVLGPVSGLVIHIDVVNWQL